MPADKIEQLPIAKSKAPSDNTRATGFREIGAVQQSRYPGNGPHTYLVVEAVEEGGRNRQKLDQPTV